MAPPGRDPLTMLDGCRAGRSRPIGLARKTGKIGQRESRGSPGAKWRTGPLIVIVGIRAETVRGMFGPAIQEGKTTGEGDRRRRAATMVASGRALPRHRTAAAAGRSRGVAETLMKAGGIGPRGMADDATANVRIL